METKKIKIVVTEKTTTDGRKKFNTYHTYSKNDRRTEVKFTKDVKELPSKTCYAVINIEDMNLNTSGEFPILWVKGVVSYEDLAAASAEINRKKINDYFG